MERNTSQKQLSNTELASFCSQLALILKSGISSIEGISIMLEESQNNAEKAILQKIYDTLLETGNLFQALEASAVFPSYLLHMVDIGEQAGRLDDVMKSLSLHYEREENISRSIRSAVTYPLIMICMMAAVVLILITKVMPIFNQVFAQLGQEMSGFSKALLSVGAAVNQYSAIFMGILVVLIGLGVYFGKTKHGRKTFASFSKHIPALRRLYEKTSSCRFADCMALTLSSGLNPDYCTELAENLIEDEEFRKKIAACRLMMREGSELSAALTQTGIFSGIYGRMTNLASRTGELDTVMCEIAEKYEEEIDNRLTAIISILEPTLVIILSLIVGIILFSVMLPLMGIMSSL